MTAEQLRNAKINKIDSILNGSWVVQRWLTDEDRRMLRADRAYWTQAGTVALAEALACYENQPRRTEAFFESKCPKCGRALSLCLVCADEGGCEYTEQVKEGGSS